MAFCNSCGATLNPGTKFCNKCGAVITPGPSAPAVTPTVSAPASTTGGSSALKIILIVLAVIVGIGILGVATVGIVGYRIAKSTHVRQEGDHVKVETPFGTVENSKDPEQAAKNLGVDIYPGAQVQKEGASSVSFGGIHTVAATFGSSDAVDKVCAYYKSRFSNAMVATSDENHCNFVSNDPKNMITINIESSGGTTRLQITNVSKKSSD